MSTKKIYIVRHGETNNNVEYRFLGSTDMPLNERGIAQAKSLNQPFSKVHLDRIYSSPYLRTMMTAREVQNGRNIEIVRDYGLCEINCGEWEGLNRAEIEEKWPGMINLWQFEPDKLHMPEGETLKQVQDRAVRSFLNIVFSERGKSVAIVSHMLTIQLIIASLFNISRNDVWRMTNLENTSITTMEVFDDNSFEITKWGENDHLPLSLRNPSVKIAGFTENENAKFDVSSVQGRHYLPKF